MLQRQGSEKVELQYLFIAEFKDGSIINQTPEDKSTTDPTRSAFFDIASRLSELKTFTLIGRNNNQSWKVDLLTGHFTHNGDPFFVGNTPDQVIPRHLIEDHPFELIYYRQHQHDINSKDYTEIAHRVRYFIGYQFNVEGKNFEFKISVE